VYIVIGTDVRHGIFTMWWVRWHICNVVVGADVVIDVGLESGGGRNSHR